VQGCAACANAWGFCEEGFRLLRVASQPESAEPSQLRLAFAEFMDRPLVRAYIAHHPHVSPRERPFRPAIIESHPPFVPPSRERGYRPPSADA